MNGEESILTCPRCEVNYQLGSHKPAETKLETVQDIRRWYIALLFGIFILEGYMLLLLDMIQSAIRCQNLACVLGAAPYFGVLPSDEEHLAHAPGYTTLMIVFVYPIYGIICGSVVLSLYLVSSQTRYNYVFNWLKARITEDVRIRRYRRLIEANPVVDFARESQPSPPAIQADA